MTGPEASTESPKWSPTTKLLVGLIFVAIIATLLVRFRNIIGPLLLAFILTYALHPVADSISKSTRLSWRASVNVVYLFLVVLLGGVSTLTGLAVVQQLQSLVGLVQRFVTGLPEMAAELSTQVYTIGPFQFGFSQFDLATITDQLLAAVQPLLGQIGNLIRTFATGALGAVGWGFFILLTSYFVLADSARWFPEMFESLEIPGHETDVRRLGRELARIWNAFLRGQLFLFLLTVVIAVIMLTILGVRFALGLALLAGLARFVPYVGPFSVWIVTMLVAVFQESNYFGLPPVYFAGVVVVAQILLDQVFDNYLSPRLMGLTLGVHPAAVLVAAIIATNLIGLVGLLLAAPVLATFQLIGRYAIRKMFEMEPWPFPEEEPTAPGLNWQQGLRSLLARVGKFQRRGADSDERNP